MEYNSKLPGPILDTLGLQRGGVHEYKLYRLVNNEQLDVAQASELGVNLG